MEGSPLRIIQPFLIRYASAGIEKLFSFHFDEAFGGGWFPLPAHTIFKDFQCLFHEHPRTVSSIGGHCIKGVCNGNVPTE